jgi:hypothetical protein
MTEELASIIGEAADAAGLVGTVDTIAMERKIGATRASVTLLSGLTVSGEPAAGDLQALRRLVDALIEVTDGATARTDRAARLIADLTSGNRILRDQLREALDDVDHLRAEREEAHIDGNRHLGELLAEITMLKMDLATARSQPTMTMDSAEAVRKHAEVARECDRLRGAYATEKVRADEASSLAQSLADRIAKKEDGAKFGQEWLYTMAVEAATAADQAFEEAKWKEGNRYRQLANMWISLLAAADSSKKSEVEPS